MLQSLRIEIAPLWGFFYSKVSAFRDVRITSITINYIIMINTKKFNWRVWEDPTLTSINILSWAYKEFNKKNAWEAWAKEEKKLIMEHFDMPHKQFPSYLNQLQPKNRYGDNGLFKSIVRAREVAWLLSSKDINTNIGEFVDHTDCWKINLN